MQDLTGKAAIDADLTCEIDALRRDVAQLDRLLGDAVVRLTLSFEAIAAETTAGGSAHHAENGGDAMVAASIAKSVGEALTALQFHDIASQLLHRVGARLDAVDRLAGVGPRPDRPVAGADVESTRDCRSWSQITQKTLAAGTVELF